MQIRNLGQSSLCFPYFPAFSAEPECGESLRLAFPISLHLVLNPNVGSLRPAFPISLHLVKTSAFQPVERRFALFYSTKIPSAQPTLVLLNNSRKIGLDLKNDEEILFKQPK